MKPKQHPVYIVMVCMILSAVSFFCAACSSLEWDFSPTVVSTTTNATVKETPGVQNTDGSNIDNGLDGEITEKATLMPQATADLSMYAVNPITGIQNMDKSKEGNRPFAIMLSNIKQATPQVGICACDMYYEIEAEGGITRIMGIFADVSQVPSMIGAVRSAREYFVDLAIGYNAIFGHYGTSTSAKKRIQDYNVSNLDGMYLSSTYWRDPERKETMGLVHSAVTSGEKLAAAISSKKYTTTGSIGNFFSFYSQNHFTVDGTLAGNSISARFSRSTTAVFDYNAQDKLYYKSQFDAPHVDAEGKQIAVTNVIVLYTDIEVLDDEGRLSVDLSQGKGYYFSGGVGKEILWRKGGVKNPIRYYNTDGTDLTVNAGKTYVCIVRSANAVTIN